MVELKLELDGKRGRNNTEVVNSGKTRMIILFGAATVIQIVRKQKCAGYWFFGIYCYFSCLGFICCWLHSLELYNIHALGTNNNSSPSMWH